MKFVVFFHRKPVSRENTSNRIEHLPVVVVWPVLCRMTLDQALELSFLFYHKGVEGDAG